jgi:hypothetical protein
MLLCQEPRDRSFRQSARDADRHSTLDVVLFTEREAAAKWLKVPVEVLMAQR